MRLRREKSREEMKKGREREREEIEGLSKREGGFAEENKKNDLEERMSEQ